VINSSLSYWGLSPFIVKVRHFRNLVNEEAVAQWRSCAPKTNYCFQWRKYLLGSCAKLVTNISSLTYIYHLKKPETRFLYLKEERAFSVIRFGDQHRLQWVTACAVKNNKEMAVTTETRWRQFAIARRGMCCVKRVFAPTGKVTLTERRPTQFSQFGPLYLLPNNTERRTVRWSFFFTFLLNAFDAQSQSIWLPC
jgi:hypothetical protein